MGEPDWDGGQDEEEMALTYNVLSPGSELTNLLPLIRILLRVTFPNSKCQSLYGASAYGQ